MKIFFMIVILLFVALFGFSWGWGLHGLMVANARRKRLFPPAAAAYKEQAEIESGVKACRQ